VPAPVRPGDVLEAGIEQVGEFTIHIAAQYGDVVPSA
jgi:2-keto-4-pentenoate hydratase/2-oxohepta-3-ene-1,7-dioic acid hydratase in catechol pathway